LGSLRSPWIRHATYSRKGCRTNFSTAKADGCAFDNFLLALPCSVALPDLWALHNQRGTNRHKPMEEIQMSINITVNGRLTKDPELRQTQTGKLVTNFGLAHNFRERAGNQFKDVVTVFFDASVWEEDGAAEVAELGLTKGTCVTVEGVWSKRTRTTKDGQPRINDVLTVSKIRLLTETEISRPDGVENGDEPAQDETVPEPAA
jgi:single-strand DNA-binding protein